MRIYDISIPLTNEMPTYPGDFGIEITAWSSLASGDSANVTHLNFGAHTGTHVDAPAHFIAGAAAVESLPLEILIGKAQVVELPNSSAVIDLQFVSTECREKRILFKTRNSGYWQDESGEFRKDFVYLELEAAKYLAEQGVKLVGIDYLSIEQFGQKDHPTHIALLSHGIVIVEGLNLSDVPPGEYELICLPLRIRSGEGDGAPARAILRTLN